MMEPNAEPEWILEKTVLICHSEQIALHGGGTGIRDISLLQSALARPMNAFYHNQVISLSKLAACYGIGIAKNHAFVDGNKRTAMVVTLTFLELNGFRVNATQEENYFTFYRLAAGELTEEQLAAWLAAKLIPVA